MLTFDDFVNIGTSSNIMNFEESFFIEKVFKNTVQSCVLGLILKCIGEKSTHINFQLSVNGQAEPLYSSHFYEIGANDDYACKYWRIPPMFLRNMKLTISVYIPNGTVLKIKRAEILSLSDFKISKEAKIRYNAHLGLWGMAPNNTVPAFELAGLSGFKSCIAVPKVTKDGVIVMIHDDTINKTARDEYGNAPESQMFVSEMTYEQLKRFDYGLYKNPVYKGTEIPTLSQFLDICQKYGMAPMFSTHPGLTLSQWEQVKRETDKRGQTEIFHIKGFGIEILESAYAVFKNTVEGYTLDSRRFDDGLLSAFSETDIAKSGLRIGFEIPFDRYTEEIARKITKKGLFASAYSIKQRYSEEYERLISYGVTEFTEDLHCPINAN